MSQNKNENDLDSDQLMQQDLMAQVLREHQANDLSEDSFSNVLNESEMMASEPYGLMEDETLSDVATYFTDDQASANLNNELGGLDASSDLNNEFGGLDASSDLNNELGGLDASSDLNNELGGLDASSDLNNEFGGLDASSDSTQINPEELTSDDEPKKKKSNTLIFGIIGVVFILILGGVFLLLSSMLSTPDATKPFVQPASQVQTAQINNPDSEISLNSDTAYNAIDGLAVNDSYEIDLADQDPEIRKHINGLYKTISDLQQNISSNNDSKTELANLADLAKQSADQLKGELQQAKKTQSKLKGQIASEKQKLKKERENSEQARKSYAQLIEDKNNELEKARLAFNKLQEESSNRAAQDSSVIKQLADNVADLTLEIRSIKAPQEKPKTVRPLAELRWIGIDYKQNAAIFEVFRNGIKDKKPIKVKPGEPILGRGVVLNVDDYGCITFDSGKKYQPLNGKCR